MRNPVESRPNPSRDGKRLNNKKMKSYGLDDDRFNVGPSAGIKDYEGPISQHHEYAITGQADQSGSFGSKSHDHRNRANTEPRGGRRALNKDRSRAHPTHPGYHVHPDHGPFE